MRKRLEFLRSKNIDPFNIPKGELQTRTRKSGFGAYSENMKVAKQSELDSEILNQAKELTDWIFNQATKEAQPPEFEALMKTYFVSKGGKGENWEKAFHKIENSIPREQQEKIRADYWADYLGRLRRDFLEALNHDKAKPLLDQFQTQLKKGVKNDYEIVAKQELVMREQLIQKEE